MSLLFFSEVPFNGVVYMTVVINLLICFVFIQKFSYFPISISETAEPQALPSIQSQSTRN